MYCINCGQLFIGSGTSCGQCGSASAAAAFTRSSADRTSTASAPYICVLPPIEPPDRSLVHSRYWIQIGAVACGLLTVVHIIVWFGVADGAMKFGTMIGGLICGVIARKLWTRNSMPAAVGAFVMLSLEAAGFVFAAVVVAEQSPSDHVFGLAVVCLLAVIMLVVGYRTWRSARQIRRVTTGG